MKPFVRVWVAALAVVAFAVATGCDKPKENSPTSKPAEPVASVAAATGAATAAAPIALSDDDVPVAEDFIEDATKEIDKDNLNVKLDDIEKEIGAE
jgi:hypothetical protein